MAVLQFIQSNSLRVRLDITWINLTSSATAKHSGTEEWRILRNKEVWQFLLIDLELCIGLHHINTDLLLKIFKLNTSRWMGRDSSVGIATRYGLGGSGIESSRGRDFPHPSRPALGHTQSPITMGTGSFPGVKRPGCGVDQQPPYSFLGVTTRCGFISTAR